MTRILLINPNISDSVSDLIRAEAQRSASPGTEVEVGVVRPGRERRETFRQGLRNVAVDAALDEHAAAGRAGLAGVLRDGLDHRGRGAVQVGVGKHDLR